MKEWFGEVKWHEDDLKNALEMMDYPVTENNVKKLYDVCNSHWFTDYIIEQGFEYMYSHIGNDDSWDRPEE